MVIHLSFSKEQYWRLVGAAKREGLTLEEWAKRLLNEAAGIKPQPARAIRAMTSGQLHYKSSWTQSVDA